MKKAQIQNSPSVIPLTRPYLREVLPYGSGSQPVVFRNLLLHRDFVCLNSARTLRRNEGNLLHVRLFKIFLTLLCTDLSYSIL